MNPRAANRLTDKISEADGLQGLEFGSGELQPREVEDLIAKFLDIRVFVPEILAHTG